MKKDDFLSDEFLKQFTTGQELTDFLKQVQTRGIEKMLEAELDAHLGYDKHIKAKADNARNGYGKKKIKTSLGETEIQVHRDIEEQMREIYGFNLSTTTTISRITDKITDDIIAWQNRPLEPVYLIVWMDGIVFKVRENSKVINKTIYIAVGLRQDGLKEVLGLWLGKNESSSFWMSVLTDMKVRGLEDILITATDNLNGFTDTIRSVFPESITQICVVHQIRNASRYVVWKDKREFSKDQKAIYTAPNRQAAEAALKDFDKK